MEYIELTPTPLEWQARAAVINWREIAAQQAAGGRPVSVPAPGDRVVVRIDGEFHQAKVAQTFGLDDEGCCLITIGVRLPAPWATRLTGITLHSPADESVVEGTVVESDEIPVAEFGEVLDLLGELRALHGTTLPDPVEQAYTTTVPRQRVDVLL